MATIESTERFRGKKKESKQARPALKPDNKSIDNSSALIYRKLVGVKDGDNRAKAMRYRRVQSDKLKADQAIQLTNAVYLD